MRALANGGTIADKQRMRPGAVILAGGRGERMGRPKHTLPFAGTTLLAHVALRVAQRCSPVVVVARDGRQELGELPAGTLTAVDGRSDGGPLAGIAAGLRTLRDAGLGDDDVAFATACDMPFVDGAVIDGLLGHLGAHCVVMPRVQGVLQPLCALYRTAVLGDAMRLLDAGERTPRSLAALPGARVLDEAEFAAFSPDLRALRNLNTPADHEAARAEFERDR